MKKTKKSCKMDFWQNFKVKVTKVNRTFGSGQKKYTFINEIFGEKKKNNNLKLQILPLFFNIFMIFFNFLP